ncbi:MAG: hypothetical protein ACK4NB_04330, partial [Fimbriimonadales bacterium]
MAVINLIAQEQQVWRAAQRKTRLLGMGAVLVVGLISVGWGALLLASAGVAMQRARVEEQMV